MHRIKAVQHALEHRQSPTYLEIGVWRGSAFRRVSADVKIAVDPTLRLSARTRRRADENARATHYFEMTSEEFFASQSGLLECNGIDVALIDGLHTYQQVVRDVGNVVRYLRDDGLIVLHDCNPASRSIAYPAASYDDFRAQNRLRSLLLLNLPPWVKSRDVVYEVVV